MVEPVEGGKTRVTVRGLGVANERERSGYVNGWAKFLLLPRDVASV